VSYTQNEELVMKNKIIVVIVLLVIIFLAGFLPQYLRVNRLQNELRQARWENSLTQIGDWAGLAYFQVSQKNYGLAAATSTRLFDRIQEMDNQTTDSRERKPLEDILSLREKITTELAKGDSGVLNDLKTLFESTHQMSVISAGAREPE
jgi:hypothetical protein